MSDEGLNWSSISVAFGIQLAGLSGFFFVSQNPFMRGVIVLFAIILAFNILICANARSRDQFAEVASRPLAWYGGMMAWLKKALANALIPQP